MNVTRLGFPAPLLAPALFLIWGVDARAGSVDYVRDVKPILTKHCVACHGAKLTKGGLRLDTSAAVHRGGKAGPAIVPGKSEESSLIEAVLGEGATERMPLKRPPLSDAQIATLRAWIDQGAQGPQTETPGVAVVEHWSFRPPVRPHLPQVKQHSWVRNPIDQFILSRLEHEKIAPSSQADRITLLRRVTFDITGLPPSPAEVDAFLADPRPDAFERVVSRLLDSPHFGERWARLWLDQARYADSNGYSIDAPRSIWKYREWVIQAFNRNMPFDQFVIDQIAGDLKPGADNESRVATGFHRNTQINQEGGIDLEQFRVDSIVDRVHTTSTVFLGLTMGCAQCHDHKFDPISQRDFYRFFAFFNNVDEPELELNPPAEARQRKEVLARIDAFHTKLLAEHPDVLDQSDAWEKTVDSDFKVNQSPEVKLAFDVLDPKKRNKSQRRLILELFLSQPAASAWKKENEEIQGLRKNLPPHITSMVVQERIRERRPTFIHIKGDFTRKGDPVSAGVPEVLPALPDPKLPNRLDLAHWLVDPRNPLTARVTVNRVWQAYFGRGLVETDNDFGTQGALPTHPELLDWLATELVASGWDLKALHFLIATSATYRQSSQARPDLNNVDRGNYLLARQSRLRIDAELIRDAALAVSGLLSDQVGGPSVFPPQPDGVMTLGQMKRPWIADNGASRYRRGLYTFFWRATPYPALTVFDAPDAFQTCTRRVRSNTPLQALTLLNDEAYIECARTLAARIVRETPAEDKARIEYAVRLCLGRKPTARESQTLARLLTQERSENASWQSSSEGRKDSAEGRGDTACCAACGTDPATLSAWTTVSRVLLNLDEFITRE
jgi:mono/diheme cytochrome c family protein